jgi:hypothetical protein
MKKLILIAMMACVSVTTYAQGQINFSNIGGTAQPSLITDTSGTTVSSTFMAALYWAESGVSDPSMFMEVPGSTKSFVGAGFLLGTVVTAPTSAAGADANFQIRAWESAFGASFEEAQAGGGQWGMGGIIPSPTKDPANTAQTAPSLVAAANAAGVPLGFQLQVVPEPSVIALGLLGAGALLVLRRRK